MSIITDIKAREILDSRGNPTVEVDVILDSGVIGRAAVPSGASTGEHEAVELRDGDASRYHGKGVLKACENVNKTLKEALLGFDALAQNEIDGMMIEIDGTENKGNLGANAILGISLAVAKAAAEELDLPLFRYLGGANVCNMPVPMANILNGGAHADGTVDLQEFMIMPVGLPSFKEGLRSISEIYHTLKKILKENGHSTGGGDEGGFAPSLTDNEEPIKLILQAIERSGFEVGRDVVIAIDAASSELVNHAKVNPSSNPASNANEKQSQYCFWKSSGKTISSDQMVDFWLDLVKKYPMIVSIEDAMGENDWAGWTKLSNSLSDKSIQLVGDDLFVTNPIFLKKGIEKKICNSILIKLNQIGTLSETMRVIELAKRHGYAPVISHRSGETEDSTIAHIAVAAGASQIKTGSSSRSDRTAKYNELIRIEEALGKHAIYDREASFFNLIKP